MNPEECKKHNYDYFKILYPMEEDICFNCIHKDECHKWLIEHATEWYGWVR